MSIDLSWHVYKVNATSDHMSQRGHFSLALNIKALTWTNKSLRSRKAESCVNSFLLWHLKNTKFWLLNKLKSDPTVFIMPYLILESSFEMNSSDRNVDWIPWKGGLRCLRKHICRTLHNRKTAWFSCETYNWSIIL